MGLKSHCSGIEAQPQSKDLSIADKQKWVRSCDVGNSYFTLTNPHSGKLLTATAEASVTVEGNKLGTYFYLLQRDNQFCNVFYNPQI